MIIYGAGDHGKVIYWCLKEQAVKVDKIFDDKECPDIDGLAIEKYSFAKNGDEKLIIAIGNNHSRKVISEKVNHNFGTFISNKSLISNQSSVSIGSMVLQGVVIQSNVKIGKHSIVNTGSVVDHDCQIGDFVHVGPNSTLCGNVFVGDLTMIGAGSVILPGVKIGVNCVVGAGSVVLKDIEDHERVAGNPARKINES